MSVWVPVEEVNLWSKYTLLRFRDFECWRLCLLHSLTYLSYHTLRDFEEYRVLEGELEVALLFRFLHSFLLSCYLVSSLNSILVDVSCKYKEVLNIYEVVFLLPHCLLLFCLVLVTVIVGIEIS
jgi:hypothetical protein